jgi:hypothetical protein
MTGLFLLAACATDSSQPPGIDGTWVLSQYGSLPVPANLVELPNSPHDPTPSGCFERITGGNLTVSASTHVFRYEYLFHHSCTGAVLSKREAQGTVIQSGSSLLFSSAGGLVLRGSVTDGELVIEEDTALRFNR